MKEEYKTWIKDNVVQAYGNCKQYTDAMKEKFPELIVCRGIYKCIVWGERDHWWLKTCDGRIVDPTVSQFPSANSLTERMYKDMIVEEAITPYRELESCCESPTGMCPECGEYIYDGAYVCSEECIEAYTKYLNSV